MHSLGKTLLAFDLLHFVLQGQICLLVQRALDFLLLLNSYAELNLEAEVEQFYEKLQDLLELTPQTHVLFIIGDWNSKVGSQEIPGVTGKFGLGDKMKQGKG